MTTHFSMKHVFSLLLAVSFLVSCTKDTEKPPVTEPQPAGNLLHKVTINNTDSMVFDYSATGILQKITATDSEIGNGATVFNFQYDGEGRVKEIATNSGTRFKFIYVGTQLKMTENYLDNKKVSENNFVWTGNRITSNTIFIGVEQGNGSTVYRPSYKATYQYDASGWLKKLSTFTINSATNVATLENERVIDQVDNKNNPLKILEPINLVAFAEIYMPKNILKETLYNNIGEEEENTVNSFVFDSQDRVVSAVSTVTSPGYTPTPIQVKYYYK